MGLFKRWLEENELTIQFPKGDWVKIRKRLWRGEHAWVTKVFDQQGKYRSGQKVRAPWGGTITVADVQTFDDPEDHPLKFKLTPEEIERLRQSGRFDLIKLTP